jgi:periplasmic protein TonB
MAAFADSRFARPVLFGALITFGMFWTMQLLIVGGRYLAEQGETLATVDFVRLKKDTDTAERERKKPPKPEPPKQPPPPQMKVEAPPPDAVVTPFNMPKLDLPTTVTGGPFIGGFVAGDSSGYSDLIPMVRINPQYPRNAARERIEGFVVFEITINPDGTVKSAKAIKSQPRGVFESAAMQAILKWKFKPKVVDGAPVESKGLQQVDFTLEKEE